MYMYIMYIHNIDKRETKKNYKFAETLSFTFPVFKTVYVNTCVCYFLFSHQMIALQKIWKSLFTSSKKL